MIFIYEVLRMLVIIASLAYFGGILWYIFTYGIVSPGNCNNPDSFQYFFNLAENTDYENLIISMYYIFTTLATVGFGDYYPINSYERIVIGAVFIFSVTVFSFIMGRLLSLLFSYNRMTGDNTEEDDLA